MDFFKKEVKFISQVFNPDPAINNFESIQVAKTATFKELDRVDKSQHKLHFKIVSLFMNNLGEKNDDGTANINLDSDALYDLTLKGIKTLIQINPEFTAQDLTEFLQDSGAIFNFAFWFLTEKLSPFFSTLTQT